MTKQITKNSFLCAREEVYSTIRSYNSFDLMNFIISLEDTIWSRVKDPNDTNEVFLHRSAIFVNLMYRLSDLLNKQRLAHAGDKFGAAIRKTVEVLELRFQDILREPENYHKADFRLFDLEVEYATNQNFNFIDILFNVPKTQPGPYDLYELLSFNHKLSDDMVERIFLPYRLYKLQRDKAKEYDKISRIIHNLTTQTNLATKVS